MLKVQHYHHKIKKINGSECILLYLIKLEMYWSECKSIWLKKYLGEMHRNAMCKGDLRYNTRNQCCEVYIIKYKMNMSLLSVDIHVCLNQCQITKTYSSFHKPTCDIEYTGAVCVLQM